MEINSLYFIVYVQSYNTASGDDSLHCSASRFIHLLLLFFFFFLFDITYHYYVDAQLNGFRVKSTLKYRVQKFSTKNIPCPSLCITKNSTSFGKNIIRNAYIMWFVVALNIYVLQTHASFYTRDCWQK